MFDPSYDPAPEPSAAPRRTVPSIWGMGERATWVAGLVLALSALTGWYAGSGEGVNVAARLVQRARAGEALFSLSVKQALDPVPQGIVELPPLVLRGRTRPVEIYCLESPSRLDFRPAAA